MLDSPSPTVRAIAEKMAATRGAPRVNLPALSRRDIPFMRCWQADPGHCLISSDFVSLEPSVTASFAEDENYRYATHDGVGQVPHIRNGILMIDDVYLMTASVMPGIRDAVLQYFGGQSRCLEWLKDPEIAKKALAKERKKAKPACLGFNYGMGPKRFVAQSYDAGMTISLDQAKAMYKAYWDLFSGLRAFVSKIEAYMKKNAFITNPFGFRLTTDPHKGYNAFIQSTASGVLDVFNLKFFPRVPDALFVALIHDEVIYQIPEGRIDAVRAIQDQCVVELNDDLGFKVPMRLGFTVARDFSEIK